MIDFQSLKITAQLSSDIAVFDDWSPSFDSLLEWLLLDERGLTAPNPTAEDVEATRPIVDENMPLVRGEIVCEWYWQTSGPCYSYSREQQDRFRKRWQPGIDSPMPNWGKRKPKWSTSEGSEKSYDLPLYLRNPQSITWYCVGDRTEIERLLQGCTGIGKKRSIGNGQILRWEVVEHESDWHLWGPNGELMRPIPVEGIGSCVCDFAIRNWGWRPPAWSPSNKCRCAMPVDTVRKLDRVTMASDGRSLAS